ncbi:UDP-N-acetylmuramate dehydrogenase [Olsenella uli DSM 7084]|uniref:UDP-N-acetylenolpyruvoylglucosamine reductase n=1 Tax=Olsenella uli (strain ATCC 49627 / DSM 7084 / CCUG 31166 / CIP 109912 / JCM 12494 / LMG 11480 / NCIMB 702895 / VPI D76D-27C) TaxID=633147 RepID=E1QX00_OLSUV|nr:UDP-N-acetylmuramate dehydrogenase [Olsenella uli]ADK68653.1 UDP-N-acetylmuramate dehydrogenase [Olsenella uli DSM 7084]EUB31259.1 UDP-N-acetylmuramate dehydrogenase [Olsenella uli MSTE5]KRO12129.1 UDP-N-acetylmuramate dehydrogenase [Olsenella uli DSM 7084]MBS6417702.1 UDP-N-acetylmuramate dehydrogenase [Olsenella uli]
MSDSADHLQALTWRLRQIVGEDGVLVDEPMSAHTTFEIGGPADLFVIPDDIEEACEAIAACREAGEECFVLGCGSDLLVSDEGYRGVVIALSDGLLNVSVEGEEMTCQAGVSLREASEMACELGLAGLEFACGIPGSVGGACFMNAGAYGGCIADILSSVCALMPDGSLANIPVGELALGYRKSRVRDEGLVVLSATFRLREGRPEDIRARMDDLTQRREEKQPLDRPSAGSTFKRPEGHFAGKLITDAGLKGYQHGGAGVSSKHAGFVVNLGGATAADVRAVISHVQDEVERQFGVRLEPEVRFLG